MRFLFLLPVLGQPRHAKRIDMLKDEGVSSEVAAFERDYHKGRIPNCPITVLGDIESGNYIKRALVYFKSLLKLRKLAKDNNVVYSFGLDLAMLSYVATLGLPINRIMEVADIRDIQTSSRLKGKVLRLLEKLFLKRLDLLVVTSPQYYNEYYKKWLEVEPSFLLVENKLEKSMLGFKRDFSREMAAVENDAITIGYFGLLRCKWSADILYTLAKDSPSDFKVILAGRWMMSSELLYKLQGLSNVKFIGEYRSPEGLADLYSSVDVVWACYSPFLAENFNALWARTNRFYESLFFKKPLISTLNSADAGYIYEKKVGLVIDASDNDVAIKFLQKNLTRLNCEIWSNNLNVLPVSDFIYFDEAKKILEALK